MAIGEARFVGCQLVEGDRPKPLLEEGLRGKPMIRVWREGSDWPIDEGQRMR